MQVGDMVKVQTKFNGWCRGIILSEDKQDWMPDGYRVLYEASPRCWRKIHALPQDLKLLTSS